MEFKSDVLGLALLGSISAFSIWSAANPSVFTISQFTTEQSKKNARLGMNIGLGLCGALSAGLFLAYGRKGTLPGILTGATGVGLYALYEHMLSGTHISNPHNQTMAEQATAMAYQGGGSIGQGPPPAFDPNAEPGAPGAPGQGGGGGGGGGTHGGAGGAGGFFYDDYGYAQGGFPGGQGPTNIQGTPETGQIGQFPGGIGHTLIKEPADPGLPGGDQGGGGGGGAGGGGGGGPQGLPGAPGGSGYYYYGYDSTRSYL